MKITTVTLKYGVTRNMGDYSNIRPEITLSAEVYDGESAEDVLMTLEHYCKKHVNNLVDQALEADGEPPHYYDGPRYTLYTQNVADKLVAIAPVGVLPNWMGHRYANRRLSVIQEKFDDQKYSDWRKFDCTDGDLSRLPRLESFEKIINAQWTRDATVYALIMAGPPLPEGWTSLHHYLGLSDRIRENVLTEVRAEVAEAGMEFIDATAGDFSRLPEPSDVQPEPDDQEFEDDPGF